MTSSLDVALAVAALLLLFLPAVILIVAVVQWIRVAGHFAGVMVAVGAVLLTLVSLDVLYSVFVSAAYGPEALAKYAMYTAFLFRGMNYLALLLIGIGLLLMSGAARSVVKPKK